ncbi:5'-3' exoribonuclease 3 isoform X2 [Daucus carota subsp. sativus]|uniref:5'-3' exoribonuclease 3 isoform X2 n=1 Tax=Daucus carota subsp. sativus TaxID=79200 RepID=UPI0007EF9D12|nr:PREDICTED: 5'-3' exoribonuclease 3-like isoform X2 [Daucus carota subsp. sativus]
MGVPAFYRWLATKYPMCIVNAIEEQPVNISGVSFPVDTTKPNPNGIEYDNLYLDMNNIIHPCFHPEFGTSPKTFNEVFRRIFEYVDRLFSIVRPRKLLFLAIDGVAPRAKMNQQRSRRFRAAKDAAKAAAEEDRLREEFEKQGRKLPPKEESQVFDSNIITPGTEFMAVLSTALQYYVHLRLNNDPGWKAIKVILSDANVPGEGEHKIMSYIRLQRNLPGFNPNTCHCLYGLDADLIMLALATHEVHFSILREVLDDQAQKDKCFICGQLGHFAADCDGKAKRKAEESYVVPKKPFLFLNIWTLRDYLEYETKILGRHIKIDFERIIDDFILMCFFVGNDFLPNMPTLDIREGAIDLLLAVYKRKFEDLGGYLTDGHKLDLSRVERFIQTVGTYEQKIFEKRARLHQRLAKRIKRDKAHVQTDKGDDADPPLQPDMVPVARFHGSGLTSGVSPAPYADMPVHERPTKAARLSSGSSVGVATVEGESNPMKEACDNKEELEIKIKRILREGSDAFNCENPQEDKVKLGEAGWRERYYDEKFSAKGRKQRESIRKNLVLSYTEGLCWVMNYYYKGVCSWQWFYPYHYAPFASEMRELAKLNISFELGTPFKPINQLLAVLPAASAHALPREYQNLMTDPNSPIIDFYPADFEVDLNGKRFDWQGVAKLSFIDETRLLAEVAKLEHTLTDEEVKRNSTMHDMLFVASSHPLSSFISSNQYNCKQLTVEERNQLKVQLDPEISGGMNGYISLCDGLPCVPISKSPVEGIDDIMNTQVICAIYRLPDEHRHITHPPVGVKLPRKTVTIGDLKKEPVLWHEDSGNNSQKIKKQLFINKPLLLQIPKGAISGQQLADAARTLVLNCLPVKTAGIGCGDQNAHLPPCSASTILEFPVHQSNEHVHELCRIVPPCEPDLPNNSLTSIVITASPQAKSSPHTARKYKEQQQKGKGKEACGTEVGKEACSAEVIPVPSQSQLAGQKC